MSDGSLGDTKQNECSHEDAIECAKKCPSKPFEPLPSDGFDVTGEPPVEASVFESYGFPAPEVMARGPESQHRVWCVLEERGDATIQEVADETELSYQTVGRYLRLFELVCPSVSKRPFVEDARITVFELEAAEDGDCDD